MGAYRPAVVTFGFGRPCLPCPSLTDERLPCQHTAVLPLGLAAPPLPDVVVATAPGTRPATVLVHSVGRTARHTLRAHAPFAILLVLGALLRILVTAAYFPAFEYVQDSFSYLHDADRLNPDLIRPVGYSVFLRGLSELSANLQIVPITQHLLALATAILVYAFVRHLGVGRWWGALAAAPLLLDAYQIDVEHFVLAETLFEALVVGGFVALLWHRRPGWRSSSLAGLLLSAATVTRTVGLVLLVLALVVLLVRTRGWRVLAGFATACVVLLGSYGGWFRAEHGSLGLVAFDGYFLAGRVLPFADCSPLDLNPSERALCDPSPRAARMSSDWYVWNPGSPLRQPGRPDGPTREREAAYLARQVILAQPGDYARVAASDLVHYFAPTRRTGPLDNPVGAWLFPTQPVDGPWTRLYPPGDPYLYDWTWPGTSVVRDGRIPARYGFGLERLYPTLDQGPATLLRDYQKGGFTPGPALALGLGLGLLAPVLGGRRRCHDLRLPAATLALAGLLCLLVPALTASFDFRYMLPALALLPPAGVLGASNLARAWRARRLAVPATPPAEPAHRALSTKPDARQHG